MASSPERAPLIVGIGGTVRTPSSSERALSLALAAAEASGARTLMIGGELLAKLPIYNPNDADEPLAAGVVFLSPPLSPLLSEDDPESEAELDAPSLAFPFAEASAGSAAF